MPSLSLKELPGVGPARERRLREWGVADLRDLLEKVPRAYKTFAWVDGISRLQARCLAVVPGRVVAGQVAGSGSGLTRLTATLQDRNGASMELVWFWRGSRANWVARQRLQRLQAAGEILVLGLPLRRQGRWQMSQPEVWIPSDPGLSGLQAGEGYIRPVYPVTEGLREAQLALWVQHALAHVADLFPEFLPEAWRVRYQLYPREKAWVEVHRPTTLQALQAARRRLAFDEAFLFILSLQTGQGSQGAAGRSVRAPAFLQAGALTRRFFQQLPFPLTADQERACREIEGDLRRDRPMRRLLQGDVGTGKTVVAAYALMRAAESGYQGAVMAPTELLAEQLASSLHDFLAPLGLNVAFLSGSLEPARRRLLLAALARGDVDVVVGTQALLSPDVVFARLGLVVVDEEHRFGVAQREALLTALEDRPPAQKPASRPAKVDEARGESRQRVRPHYLAMSATPIPRSLALVVAGDMEVSFLAERPAGRRPVDTRWLPEARRERAYEFLRRLVQRGQQAYIVYPRLEGGADPAEGPEPRQARSAREGWEYLRQGPLRDLRVGLLHARLAAEEKEAVMRSFRAGELDVLVATTVVEVGVDVPNATVMLIEEPDRFGLAQLHQLRGRVGRGSEPGYCLLMGDGRTPQSRQRLDFFRRCHDGFALAEYDLKLRGPGEMLGLRQSGRAGFRFFDPVVDHEVVEMAREAVRHWSEEREQQAAQADGDDALDWERVQAEISRWFPAAQEGRTP